jgi:hypothetical protein
MTLPDLNYNLGFVRKASRNEVIAIANQAATRADLADEDRETILNALRDPAIEYVATQIYIHRRYEEETGKACRCPGILSGLIRDTGEECNIARYKVEPRIAGFPASFDNIIREVFGGRTQLLHLVSD